MEKFFSPEMDMKFVLEKNIFLRFYLLLSELVVVENNLVTCYNIYLSLVTTSTSALDFFLIS